MKGKEKVKKFCDEHLGSILTGGLVIGACILGYKAGTKYTTLRIGRGLQAINEVEPELYPLIERGAEKLNTK